MNEETYCVINSDEISRAGFVQLSTLVLLDPELSDSQVRLYGILLEFARQEGYCYPKVATLQKLLHCSDRTVQRHMDALVQRGLVIRKERRGQSNIYDLSGFRRVYGEGEGYNALKAEVLDSLESVGKRKFVQTVRKAREVSLQYSQNFDNENNSVKDFDQRPTVPQRSFDAAMEKVRETEESSERAQQRRQERQKQAKPTTVRKKPGPTVFTTKDFEEEWRAKMVEMYPGIPGIAPPWEIKHRSMVKRLSERFSSDGVSMEQLSDAFSNIIEDWDDFVDRYGVKGYPSVQRIVYFADIWIPEVLGKKKIDPRSKRAQKTSMRDWDKSKLSEKEKQGGQWFFGN